jgi:hypothetical protein
MPSRTLLYCSVCEREMTGRVVEVRIIVAVDEANGRHHEHAARVETCSPACSLKAARSVIEEGEAS